MLLDRLSERVQIDHVLASAKRGMSAVLVLQGEAGAGKTALLDYAIDSAGDLDVIRLVGIESEAELGFAALHQLLVPYLGRVDSLPAPLNQALATAFGFRARPRQAVPRPAFCGQSGGLQEQDAVHDATDLADPPERWKPVPSGRRSFRRDA
jgi:hypothetical protein